MVAVPMLVVVTLPAPLGEKRSACSGTFSTSSFSAVTILALAVIPGLSSDSGLDTLNHHVIGDDVLHGDRRLPHLTDTAGERMMREKRRP